MDSNGAPSQGDGFDGVANLRSARHDVWRSSREVHLEQLILSEDVNIKSIACLKILVLAIKVSVSPY
jgi:hypothetical protein